MSQSPRHPKQPPAPPASEQSPLHPRNRHQGRYDFAQLVSACPELGAFLISNPHGKPSIDFANPSAVRVFNRALLKSLYGIAHWELPEGYLCPPVPGRADYLHGLADLLAEEHAGVIPRGAQVRVLDIGVGANCIYPLLGHSDYGWDFLGSDIDASALACARATVTANGLAAAIQLRLQSQRGQIFAGLLQDAERFDLSLCNPPFHASAAEAASGSRRKWKNLGKLDPRRKLPELNFGGQHNELWCTGGEASFVKRMLRESQACAGQVLWFSTLVSKGGNLADIHKQLDKLGACAVRTVAMAQGNKQSRFVAWTFLDAAQRRQWREARWAPGAGSH
ncbi:23S rRNA (adenine(1618)-N(6))-methyltransferase RlmF [Pseudomonas sp. N040]|uniref:23S rRNA (adenine(1618)-N(6))-methyltransferase RlmF n=1 Tax=Pseudomonas sp. N040 TaxID=2785325 RepID=UPI0018A254C1|nr:23S rRNA (adenine(1618)-N(6))-methyltransferase RlmF [Pseudomonas sp. N040]MBF7730454.1 23S rRNA (adenine(1618)-N(6))-methyltransferase RlmF [Pseudomonas sp. N040]MBW7014097.1 23S rRNA (adenine(1618)-N(6))-methyltransferase RlmF [Pseudomonas sp. N040]